MEVDHIERIADGGHPLGESNLQTLCSECHAEKTADENSTTTRDTVPDVTLDEYLKS
ncbi:HNH endonuclease signature motif containing protein [Natrinema sp. SYSU A 869]|uniref:HNH endonuclease n=1 Tax=Natrinema sp. SYSU A 869 TaxID=2871694 RepID=UPI001CA3FD48|nr:HNH endonuclease signature motif containing protein [Natrinema sp. SYSU A 869]